MPSAPPKFALFQWKAHFSRALGAQMRHAGHEMSSHHAFLRQELVVAAGTVKPDDTLKTYCCILPSDRHPIGEIVLPPAGPNLKAVRMEVKFGRLGCICHAHVASIDVP